MWLPTACTTLLLYSGLELAVTLEELQAELNNTMSNNVRMIKDMLNNWDLCVLKFSISAYLFNFPLIDHCYMFNQSKICNMIHTDYYFSVNNNINSGETLCNHTAVFYYCFLLFSFFKKAEQAI